MKKRLKALEAKTARDGTVLSEAEVVALETAKLDQEAHGELESGCPGYCGAQDRFHVGTLRGVGREPVPGHHQDAKLQEAPGRFGRGATLIGTAALTGRSAR